MKKLTVLVVIMLVAGLLAGCWLFPDEPKLISIVVEPESMELTSGNTEPIISVEACYDDWTIVPIDFIDCEYLSSDIDVAMVDNEGLVTAVDTGEAIILVSYTEGKFPFEITETDIVGVFVNQ